jgi:hypothetical protein
MAIHAATDIFTYLDAYQQQPVMRLSCVKSVLGGV